MEIPDYQPFYIGSADALRAEVSRLGLEVPLATDISPLAAPFILGSQTIPNRFCAQPIAGGDAQKNGAPSALTRRRYRNYAAGAFGLIWMERTTTAADSPPSSLRLSQSTFSQFSALLLEMHAAATHKPFVVLQVSAAHQAELIATARLARDVGFDGIDFQAPRELMPRLLEDVKHTVPDLALSTRLCAYEAFRGGFGVSDADYRKQDPSAPMDYVRRLVGSGLQVLNLTAYSPRLMGPERGTRPVADHENPQEHPLMTLARQLSVALAFRTTFPNLPVIGSGLSWLRDLLPQVASGAVAGGWMDFAGLGRSALAFPSLPARVLNGDPLESAATCMMCFACSTLMDAESEVGCVLRDAEVYGPVFRNLRRFDDDSLTAGASRCHLCEAPPCREKSPTRTLIPEFIKAFRESRSEDAFALIRQSNPLPEMVAQTSPAWLEEEGACIERTLTGAPVPINDLQYAIAWQARQRKNTGVRIPPKGSDKTVAIIGGGPTGISAAVRLLEWGHRVHILESSQKLGGVPARLLSKTRAIADPSLEIEALLAPAYEADRLTASFGQKLGTNVFIDALLKRFDAVLVAVGLWKERSIGFAHGVLGALDILELGLPVVPQRVAVLAGGDSAMDACSWLHESGTRDIYVIFEGARSEMHWHMPEGWFARQGIHAMMNWRPLSYELNEAGRLKAVRLLHTELGAEVSLHVDLAVEAMGLGLCSDVAAELATVSNPRVYKGGAMSNGGASAGHCVAEGMALADSIHNDLIR